jgi:adenosylhomocysteinase
MPPDKAGIYRLPKKLDGEAARLRLDKIGVKLTRLTKKQADCLGVPVGGPCKPGHFGLRILSVPICVQLAAP